MSASARGAKINKRHHRNRLRQKRSDAAPAVLREVAGPPEEDIFNKLSTQQHNRRRNGPKKKVHNHAGDNQRDPRHAARTGNKQDESEGSERPSKSPQ